jgi:hypothetical protein
MNTIKWVTIIARIVVVCTCTTSYATTFEQEYYSDGNDHFMYPEPEIESGGTHTFFVNHVSYGYYNYVAYKRSSSLGLYFQIWTDSTSTGWDPSFSTYVSPGYQVKLVIYDGNWSVVKSVYYCTTVPTFE